ncbi:hypothetical protein RJT34_25255 [Clitoria ternatea]|uniref:Uncharacterized protein n=1 Tax=Clitoria ternatea TaxID=43366 RepID=A0AAN9IGP1_CLITE
MKRLHQELELLKRKRLYIASCILAVCGLRVSIYSILLIRFTQNWLDSSETTPVKNKANSLVLYSGTPDRSSSQCLNFVISYEDSPILGAVTVEELKQFSASSSPRKSPCRAMDNDIPRVGNVGS